MRPVEPIQGNATLSNPIRDCEMQITHIEITPVELKLERAVQFAGLPAIEMVMAVFLRMETRQGRSAWGCCVAHPALTGERPADVLRLCHECAAAARDLNPLNLEYSLAVIEPIAAGSAATRCAFDLAFHDLLGLAAGMPLFRLLGGYRHRIQTSATVPLLPIAESVEWACERARLGFRMLKIKGGVDPEMDVRRVRSVADALPNHELRLDADGGYSVSQALDVARGLQGCLTMLEQPTPPADLEALAQVSAHSPVPVLADQSVCGSRDALILAARRSVSGLSAKMATCGGIRGVRQVDAIARAAGLATMVNCTIEPALLIGAGLHFALSSPNVRYADLDGYLDLVSDPTVAGFHLEEGWLVASDMPGLGCTVDLG